MVDLGLRPQAGSAVPDHVVAGLWTAFVCVTLTLPVDGLTDRAPPFPEGTDKLVHGLLFFFESLFLLRSFRHLRLEYPLPAAVAAAVLLGAATESVQLFLPHRSGDGADLVADALGAGVFGVWAWRASRRRSP